MSFYDAMLHLDSPEIVRLNLVLRNAANYLNALPNENFNLEIIANGGGVVLLTKEREELYAQAAALVARGLKIKVCANALKDHNLVKDDMWPECEVVPAGLVEIVRLQKSGYAYIKP